MEGIVKAGTEGAERLVTDLEDRVAKDYSNIEAVVEELKTELAEKSEEIVNIIVSLNEEAFSLNIFVDF